MRYKNTDAVPIKEEGATKMPNELKRTGGDDFMLPPIKSVKIGVPMYESDFSLTEDVTERIIHRTMAIVADQKDKLLIDAVIDYAKKSGYTELCLIDEEFVKSALIHEAERRANDE